jgi:CUG-BP- and ETR3-like factor
MMHGGPKADPVCPEPKVFAGQVPLEATQEQVLALFSQYGTVRNVVIITHQDGRSKGAAMVLFEHWGHAEAAIDGENNACNLGGTKPLVVRMADPPKRGDGPAMGIAPRKLFVGQVRSG